MNKTSLYQFTIIIPVYNEEENIYYIFRSIPVHFPVAYKA